VCVYACNIYMHIYMYTYMHEYVYAYTYIYVHLYYAARERSYDSVAISMLPLNLCAPSVQVCACMRVCVYVHGIYIHVYVCIYMHQYVHTYGHLDTYIYTYIELKSPLALQLPPVCCCQIYVRLLNMCICACVLMHIMYTYTYICIHIYMHVYILIHTYKSMYDAVGKPSYESVALSMLLLNLCAPSVQMCVCVRVCACVYVLDPHMCMYTYMHECIYIYIYT